MSHTAPFSQVLQLSAKVGTITLLASTVTLGTFAFMQYLVGQDAPPVMDTFTTGPVTLFEPPKPAELIERKTLPEPPKMPPKVERPTPEVTPQVPNSVTIGYKPEIASPAPNINFNGVSDREQATPLVQVPPHYPVKAARDGIEGYVVLSFSITELGTVTNVDVVASEPKRLFDKDAKKALKKWKYQPKVVDGKAMAQHQQTVRLDFTLDDSN